VNGDVECKPCGCITFGAHAQVRFRDESPFRTFFGNDRVWLYEGYAYAKAPAWGTIKAGKIWSRFGLDWDDSFWGNVAYYNGYKLDPEWGVSWEHQVDWTRLSLPWFVQVFFGEDEVNGSIAGGGAESSAIIDEEITGIVRVVPTYHLNKNTDIALGLSALAGSVTATDNSEDMRTAFSADLTVTWCDLKVYGEVIFADGGVHESHYATGGQTTGKTIFQGGAAYTYGPATIRGTYSRGEYTSPGGNEDILLLGLDLKVTNWLTLTVEYQDWNVKSDAAAASTSFEDGVSIILHWDV
jgi:predicted porin